MFGVQFDLVLTIPVQTRRAAVPQNYNTSQLKDNVPFDKQTCSGSQIKYILFCHVPW